MTGSARDLNTLRSLDETIKPPGADDEWIIAYQHYEDTARQLTITRLAQIGAGIKDNYHPLEVALLRRIIDRLAVVYDRPPTRWLVNAKGTRKAETSAAHQAMINVLSRAQYDLAWRRVDRLRALMRQCVIRFYPNDDLGSVSMRIFEPFNVMRDPDPGTPDRIESDRRFALCLACDRDNEVWEYWDRDAAGEWQMTIVNKAGEPHGDVQPFAPSSGTNPYSELPVQIIYDDYTGGRPWLAPRGSRTAWVEAINCMANDLWALILHEAHSQTVIATDNAQDVPREHGPGKVWALPKDSVASVLSGNPKLADAQGILDNFVRLWSLSEDLPATEFDKSKQVVTGATLKVQSRPLIARREAQVPLAESDERMAYRKLRAVHNLHVDSAARRGLTSWDLPALDLATNLEVEIADVDIPTDMAELQDAGAKSLMIGTKSVIDLIQSEQNVPRHVAIKIYERVSDDFDAYPPRTQDLAAIQGKGPQAAGGAGPKEAPSTAEALSGKPSVVQAIK